MKSYNITILESDLDAMKKIVNYARKENSRIYGYQKSAFGHANNNIKDNLDLCDYLINTIDDLIIINKDN